LTLGLLEFLNLGTAKKADASTTYKTLVGTPTKYLVQVWTK
jgi:hypothetical protein